MKNIRINNVEYKTSTSLDGEEYEEVILWYPNPRYGKEEDMKKDGWCFDEDGNAHKDNIHISSTCFKGKMNCYTVAYIEWNRAHDEYDIRSVGLRAFEFENEDDQKDFLRVIKLIGEVNSEY